MVVLPRPEDRVQLVKEIHQGLGHFGVQRTLDRLYRNYRWIGMGDTVVIVTKACLFFCLALG